MKEIFCRILALLSISVLLWQVSQASYATGALASEEAGSAQELKINFVISEPCSLVEFLNTIAERPHTTVWLKDWFWQKRESSAFAEDKAMIALYKDMIDGDHNHYDFVAVTGRGIGLYQKILTLAADSRDLPELYAKTQPVLKDKDFQTLKKALEYFAPVYRDMVWQPCLPTLEKQLEDYRRLAIESKMAERLTAVQKFMKAPWVVGLPFTIVLVPLPFNGKGTHGETMGQVQIVELKPESTFENNADVVFHEGCHALWFSIKDVPAADKAFVTAAGKALPMTELYEGMATALSQGWFATEAFGKTPKSWYVDATINLYAHKVFPLYAEYLKAGRPVDGEFGRRATDIYYKNFPDADVYVAMTSNYLIIAEQIPDPAKFKTDVDRALPRLRHRSVSSPIDASESLKAWKEFDGRHAAILADATTLDKLAVLGITPAQIDLLRRTTKAVTLQVDKKQILFCIADTPAEQQKMYFDCLKKNKWPVPLK